MFRSRPVLPALALAAAVAAGCGAGTPNSPAPSAPSPTAVPGSPAVTGAPATPPESGTPAVTASPAMTPVPAAPPQVFAAAPGGTPVPGDQGSFSWDGFVSDSPWVLGRARLEAGVADALDVTVAGGLETRRWTAVWARVTDGSTVAGTPEGEARGTGLPIVVEPPGAGAWSLRVEVWSGDLGHATWYWQVDVSG